MTVLRAVEPHLTSPCEGEEPEALLDLGKIFHQHVNNPLLSPAGRLRQRQGEVPRAVKFESPKRSLEALAGIALTDLSRKDSNVG